MVASGVFVYIKWSSMSIANIPASPSDAVSLATFQLRFLKVTIIRPKIVY